MTTWFTSDEHYGHKNIIEYSSRPFRDVEHMQNELVKRHNAVVGRGDVVYHLGDFSLDDREVLRVLPLLYGTHRLICGNHDTCHPSRKKHEAAKRYYLSCGFESVATKDVVEGFLLSHFPYEFSHATDFRHAEWRPKYEGKVLLHGHVHEAWRTKTFKTTNQRMINVGVDVWNYEPVCLEALQAFDWDQQ